MGGFEEGKDTMGDCDAGGVQGDVGRGKEGERD
jgi:hypothetical protein